MKLRDDQLKGIREFFDFVPPQALARGLDYFKNGHVLRVECLDEGAHYKALVRGGQDFIVLLDFEEGEWLSTCTCPVEFDCKHAVAALFALRESAGERKLPAATKPKRPSGVPQPAGTAIYRRLRDSLGRDLRGPEAAFVRRVQNSYAEAAQRPLRESDLDPFLPRPEGFGFNYWQTLELWPSFPPDDFYFWLYLAWELRKRQRRLPDVVAPITDFSLIEGAMKKWELEKEIQHWTAWFQNGQPGPSLASEPSVLEVRLFLTTTNARLQWRDRTDAPFVDMKQTHAKRLAGDIEHGGLNLAENSLALWAAAYKPWNHGWHQFDYTEREDLSILSRLLRLRIPADRAVTADGQPLARREERLQLRLQEPAKGQIHYELSLALPDGSPPPPIWAVLPGHPAFYLTDAGLFPGPASEALDANWRRSIPTVAIESAEGLRYLHANGVPLPEALARRVQNVPVTVKLTCELKTERGCGEEVVIRAEAAAPGLSPEEFVLSGWQPSHSRRQAAPARRDVVFFYDRAAQRHFPRLLEAVGAKWDNYSGFWRLRLTKKTPETLAPWLKSIPPEIELSLDDELATLRGDPIQGQVTLDVTESAMDWFDLRVALKVADTTLTQEELNLLLNARGGYVRLRGKGWRRLQFNLTPEEDEQLARLGLSPREFSSEPQRFHALQLADDAAKKFLGPERIEKIQRRAAELKTRVAPPAPPEITATMRPYQTEGFHFLAYLASNRFGGVLADDMGLGKTLQTLAWLAWLRGEDGAAPAQNDKNAPALDAAPASSAAGLPTLVVCPKSVTDNWRNEAKRFYPTLRVRLWRGEDADALAGARDASDLIVVNYAQLRALSPAIAQSRWRAVILDEAQYIKNPDSLTAQSARALQADHCLALTGTPIENRLLDLWSILSFAMPGALGNRSQFLRRFNAQDDPLARRRLSARVRPFLLRRTKAQVAKDLPPRIEEDLFCEMEGPQRSLYRAELKRARQVILGLKSHQELNRERFNVLTSLLRLRQICCHPALVDENLRQAESAKVSALEDLLEPLIEEGHKVLVFSQFTTMLALLKETLTQHGWPHFYLAGETENRGALVESFQSAPGGAVFLVSLKAGGFGLNLTAASYVVLFDPWWNPAVENQAIDRTHRIGQTSTVMAYRLIVKDSIEQKIRVLQRQKSLLAEDVLGEERFAQSLTLDDLRTLFED